MKKNIGSIDRVLRIIIGIALIAATLTNSIGILGWVGVVPLLTAIFSFCPLYKLLGFDTCGCHNKKD